MIRPRLWMLGVLLLAATVAARTQADSPMSADAGDWPMFNHDPSGSRYNTEERTLGVSNAAGLQVLWRFSTPAPVSGTPAVVDGVAYVGDTAGNFYALSSSGQQLWRTQVNGPVSASALVAGSLVVFGDGRGNLYGLRRDTGAIAWSFRPDPHPLSAIWGSPTRIGQYAAIGVASNEEFATKDPSYPCCSSRGSLVLFDPTDGHVVWQAFTISDAERATGASGASIWSTPSYDPGLKAIFVTTGNNFSQPTTSGSDAILAFDATTGALLWANQRTPNDEWNFRFPFSPDHPDGDFGDSPQVYRLPDGRKVVGAGQKTGFYHVVDAVTGALINQTQLEPGGLLGGLFADTAVADGVVFVNGIDWPGYPFTAPVAGDLIALSGDASTELWRFTTPGSPDLSGVAVANGVVYFTSSYSQNLFALSTSDGALLAHVPIGRSFSGPAIAGGKVYVGTGDAVSGFGVAPGSVVCLGP